jgi:hypothetical protein
MRPSSRGLVVSPGCDGRLRKKKVVTCATQVKYPFFASCGSFLHVLHMFFCGFPGVVYSGRGQNRPAHDVHYYGVSSPPQVGSVRGVTATALPVLLVAP